MSVSLNRSKCPSERSFTDYSLEDIWWCLSGSTWNHWTLELLELEEALRGQKTLPCCHSQIFTWKAPTALTSVCHPLCCKLSSASTLRFPLQVLQPGPNPWAEYTYNSMAITARFRDCEWIFTLQRLSGFHFICILILLLCVWSVCMHLWLFMYSRL